MHVRFSFEPRLESVENTLAMCDDIMAAYPMIDSLELTTNENGGGGDAAPQEMRAAIEEYFTLAAYDDAVLAREFEAPPSAMVTMLRELGHNIRVVRALREQRPYARDLPLVLGVYCIPESFGQVAIKMLDAYAPQDCEIALMPQYGSRWVGHRFESFEVSRSAWERLNVYSWVEFDGMFFFQQNEVDGVRHLLDVVGAGSGHEPIHAIAFNTWRTAENQISLRYAAESCICGPVSTEEFYRRYAGELGIDEVKSFVRAMRGIDDAVEKARDTWNVGFAWPWMWVGWWSTNLTGWDYGKLEEVQQRFERAAADLKQCAEGDLDPEGDGYVSFLQNRVRASIFHLKGLMALYEIVPFTVDDDRQPVDAASLTDEQRAQFLRACDSATYYTNRYMSTYAETLPDRGSEGALIIYYYCLPELIRKLRREYGGDTSAELVPIHETDTWPEPAAWK
jgi:hypothetical protein